MPGEPPPRLRYVTTWANAQPALGAYRLDRDALRYVPICLDVLTITGQQISAVTAFRTPDVFPRFGLPDHLAW